MADEIVNNFELKPVIVGAIISIVLMLLTPDDYLRFLEIIIGSAVAGFICVNSTKYAMGYGALIGIISSIVTPIPIAIIVYMILGLFGGFIGKLIQSNL